MMILLFAAIAALAFLGASSADGSTAAPPAPSGGGAGSVPALPPPSDPGQVDPRRVRPSGPVDPSAARRLASEAADAVELLRVAILGFQAAANIARDGLYGPVTAGALVAALRGTGVADAPAPFTGSGTVGFSGAVSTAMRERGTALRAAMNATAGTVAQFQLAAGLVPPDGLYGGATAGAVLYWSDTTPPAPLVERAGTGLSILTYLP